MYTNWCFRGTLQRGIPFSEKSQTVLEWFCQCFVWSFWRIWKPSHQAWNFRYVELRYYYENTRINPFLVNFPVFRGFKIGKLTKNGLGDIWKKKSVSLANNNTDWKCCQVRIDAMVCLLQFLVATVRDVLLEVGISTFIISLIDSKQ